MSKLLIIPYLLYFQQSKYYESDIFALSPDDDEDAFASDDDATDPDWRNTPAAAQRRAMGNLSNQSNRSNDATTLISNIDKTVNRSRHLCSCKSDCKKQCGCRRNNLACDSTCKCPVTCTNIADALVVSATESDTYVTVKSEISLKREIENQKENDQNRDTTPKRIKYVHGINGFFFVILCFN